jgi:hypothetical protein
MTNSKIEAIINDPDKCARVGELIQELTVAEFALLKRKITPARKQWAWEQRQKEEWQRREFGQ